jgi:hypothetical protein
MTTLGSALEALLPEELIALKPDVLVSDSNAVRILREKTTSIPRPALRSWMELVRSFSYEKGVTRDEEESCSTSWDPVVRNASRFLRCVAGTGWERTPCHATQRAAWEALKRRQRRANCARSHPVCVELPRCEGLAITSYALVLQGVN